MSTRLPLGLSIRNDSWTRRGFQGSDPAGNTSGSAGDPEEVARIAVFLLSEDARYITGQVIQADGGLI